MDLKRCAAAAVLALAGASSAARAATEANFSLRTTGDLVELCAPSPDNALAAAAINFCHGFAMGAVLLEQEHDAASRSLRMFCLPTPPPSRSEGLGEFVRWAKASPARLNEPPVDGLFRFLAERFPCPSRS